MHSPPDPVLFCVFLAAAICAGLVLTRLFGRDRELSQRLDDLRDPLVIAELRRKARSAGTAQDTVFSALSRFGTRLLPGSDAARARLLERFMHAGIYSPAAPSIFLSVRFVTGLAIPLLVMVGSQFGLIDRPLSLPVAGGLGLLGFVATSQWLNSQIARRQREFRKSIPDFLDLMGTCIQAGQSFEAALARVTDELRSAHTVLTFELTIVQREMTLGSPAARALRSFAERSGLDIVRQLATLVDQSQRFGSSMTDSLRVYADMLRTQRSQQAETLAHKAGVKILLPTLIFIFPPVLLILAGPAAIDLHEKLVVHRSDERR